MLGPVHAVHDQLNRRRIDDVDHSLESSWNATMAMTQSKFRANGLQVFEHLPKQRHGPFGKPIDNQLANTQRG